MPDIFISVQYFGSAGSSGQIEIYGAAVDSENHYQIGWNTVVTASSSAAQINADIKAAVVAGFAALEPPITGSGSDKKVLFGGAS